MKEIQVIGHYQPPKRKAYLVGQYITRLTEKLGLVPFDEPLAKHHRKAAWFNEALHAECRLKATTREDEEWHHDLDNTPGARTNCGLVLWAECAPTEFRDSQSLLWTAQPYDIVLAHNDAVTHRRPPNAPVDRMSFRQRVEWPT